METNEVRVKNTYYFAIEAMAFLSFKIRGVFRICLVEEDLAGYIEQNYFVFFFLQGKVQTLGLGAPDIFHKDLDWQKEYFRFATEDEVAKAMMLGL